MTSNQHFRIIMHFLPFLLHAVAQQLYPEISCPGIFRYSYDERFGGNYGLIVIPRDGSPTSELRVNMSVNTRTAVNSNIKIVVISKQDEIFYGNNIKYAVRFPLQNILPKLTEINFNGRTICYGEPDPLEPGIIQTSMWAMSTITTFTAAGQNPNTPIFNIPNNSPNNSPNNIFTDFTSSDPDETFKVSNSPVNPFIPTTSEAATSRPMQQTSPPKPTIYPTQCGMGTAFQYLIIGGDDIGPGEFPWLVSIMIKDGISYKYRCAGNLISDRHVLTAGHCLRYYNAALFAIENIIVVMGTINMNTWAVNGVIRDVKAVEPHPDYRQGRPDADLAVIIFKDPVEFSRTVKPVCLWEQDEDLGKIIGTTGTAVGWRTNSEGQGEPVAQKIDMPIADPVDCIRSNKVFREYVSDNTFCAGKRDNTGPCTGDSGVGFLIKDEATQKWYLRGLVVFSLKNMTSSTVTCDLLHYVIFTDVAKKVSWIREQMRKR